MFTTRIATRNSFFEFWKVTCSKRVLEQWQKITVVYVFLDVVLDQKLPPSSFQQCLMKQRLRGPLSSKWRRFQKHRFLRQWFATISSRTNTDQLSHQTSGCTLAVAARLQRICSVRQSTVTVLLSLSKNVKNGCCFGDDAWPFDSHGCLCVWRRLPWKGTGWLPARCGEVQRLAFAHHRSKDSLLFVSTH